MRKMTFTTILSVLALIIGTAAITRLICDNRHEAEIINLKSAKSTAEYQVSLLKKTNEAQQNTISALRSQNEQITVLEGKLSRKADEIEMLNDLVAKLTASPYNPKERIPPGNTDWYYLEKHTAITDTASIQYKLQQACTTGIATGIRIYEDEEGVGYYTVAMGSAYGRDIGDAWRVTLDNGEEFNVMLGDFKDDGKTEFFGHPCRNEHEEPCTNVIEFIVDWDNTPEDIREYGSMSTRSWCDGNIIEIEYLGRKWGGVKE